MSILSNQEMSRLVIIDQSRLYLCAIKTTNGEKELSYVNREDITVGNLIKRFFNCGVLAHLKFSLTDVTEYLTRFDWTAAKTANADSLETKAYKAAIAIANKYTIKENCRSDLSSRILTSLG